MEAGNTELSDIEVIYSLSAIFFTNKAAPIYQNRFKPGLIGDRCFLAVRSRTGGNARRAERPIEATGFYPARDPCVEQQVIGRTEQQLSPDGPGVGLDALGNDFEKTTKGYIDFLLLDDKGRPFFPFLISYLRSQFGIGFFTTHLLFWSFNLNCYRNNSETFPICRITQSLIKRNKALVGRESLTPLNSGSQL